MGDDEKKVEKAWSPMKMLDLCYQASDAARELIRQQEKIQEKGTGAPAMGLDKLVSLHATLVKFTNEVQHVWDEYVELLDAISEARPVIETLDHNWMVRDVLTQHDFIIRTWDKEDE